MTPAAYLRDKLGRFLFFLVSTAALAGFLLATGSAPGVVGLLLLCLLLIAAALVVVDFLTLRRRLDELNAIMDGLDQKYLFAECVPGPGSLLEKQYLALLKRSYKSMIERVSGLEESGREYREYIEQWVHEIKAPITVVRLACENEKNDFTRKILAQLERIEGHVERSLYYARSGNVENDFLIRETPLGEVVDGVIARNRQLLIQSGARIETENLGVAVYADGKWLDFILTQLLVNSAKYRSAAPVIEIGARAEGEDTVLCVRDNGIGIAPDELPRIFEKGFTGTNGRSLGSSTGIGLYLCRKLCARLGLAIAARSRQGEFTEIALRFPGAARGSDSYETVRRR